ncbi:nuclear speckle RNA-binding protein B-like [Mangifera indica]|uniref:nuclear speckle RNA-binding protein B-like n=1 Tax=Mangifera indica TaxID=29780 RepID=UPI001CFB100A|nr:nuclear speckle RNA-binding protein B-like [Mangifera indica]
MDSLDFPVSKSPRRELQGPRPAPLKVSKDSHKIRKPPVPQPQQQQHQNQQQHQHHHQAQPRPPVIIYTVSPKVIHTKPSDFMTLVQRLTGSSSTLTSSAAAAAACTSSSSSICDPFNDTCDAISPAARYASIEKAAKTPDKMNEANNIGGLVEGIEMDYNIERSSFFPGILSPGPTSLPMISPNFFSLPSDPNSFSNIFHDLSPVPHGNKNFLEGSFMPSPSSFLSPHITSPTPSIDLFNNFVDF